MAAETNYTQEQHVYNICRKIVTELYASCNTRDSGVFRWKHLRKTVSHTHKTIVDKLRRKDTHENASAQKPIRRNARGNPSPTIQSNYKSGRMKANEPST